MSCIARWRLLSLNSVVHWTNDREEGSTDVSFDVNDWCQDESSFGLDVPHEDVSPLFEEVSSYERDLAHFLFFLTLPWDDVAIARGSITLRLADYGVELICQDCCGDVHLIGDGLLKYCAFTYEGLSVDDCELINFRTGLVAKSGITFQQGLHAESFWGQVIILCWTPLLRTYDFLLTISFWVSLIDSDWKNCL